MTRRKTRTPMSCPIEERNDDVVPGWIWRRSLLRGRRAAGSALAVAGIALLLAACSTTPDSTPATTGTGTAPGTDTSAPIEKPAVSAPPAAGKAAAAAELRGSYVALGDSYAAGLDIPDQTGATAGCGQSSSSYPFLVARSLRLELTDMSCSSATVASLSAAQATGEGTNPAQLSALSAATALVTLGIGGNDVGWAGIVTRCTELDLIPSLIPSTSAPDVTPCQDYYTSGGTDQIQQRISAVTGQLAEALTQIRQRAPRARVYVIGYPDLLPASGGGCGHALGITRGDIAFLDNEELRLNAMLRQAAQAAGDGYVDTYTPSEGHDACAAPADRWIEPLIPDAAAAPLHPNAVGQQGMADTIIGALRASA